MEDVDDDEVVVVVVVRLVEEDDDDDGVEVEELGWIRPLLLGEEGVTVGVVMGVEVDVVMGALALNRSSTPLSVP